MSIINIMNDFILIVALCISLTTHTQFSLEGLPWRSAQHHMSTRCYKQYLDTGMYFSFLYSDGPSSLLVHKFLGDQLCLIVEDEGDSNDLSTASCVYYFCWCTGLYIAYSAAVMIHVALLNHRISKQWYDSEVTIILFTYHTIWIARCTGTSFVYYTVCTISIQGN